jgi:hypothetical protein
MVLAVPKRLRYFLECDAALHHRRGDPVGALRVIDVGLQAAAEGHLRGAPRGPAYVGQAAGIDRIPERGLRRPALLGRAAQFSLRIVDHSPIALEANRFR